MRPAAPCCCTDVVPSSRPRCEASREALHRSSGGLTVKWVDAHAEGPERAMREVTPASFRYAATRTIHAFCPDCLDRTFWVSKVAEILRRDGTGRSAHFSARSVATGR